ncbi:MAG: thioredoxin domain-containing protein [Chloroflexota bacterium]|nr:thioredoxin domain-containing protein [Chloroflexota bacterium]
MPNRLADESSPYLLQHKDNPVDWYPWGEEALERARRENRPILLSIGYSACHWCHVMEHESFEDQETAEIMNEHFVNIKVDREERPDLDSIYMDAVTAMTGHGGWPMTVFLTPEAVPFYGGTYYPPEPRYGMPSFKQVLRAVADSYDNRQEELVEQGQKLLDHIARRSQLAARDEELNAGVLDRAFEQLMRQFDARWGGFGTSGPKFPQPMVLEFVLRYYRRRQDSRARRLLDKTLQRMAYGGMYDQLGGGFHRYSVDEKWLVPHFEKMLYDNGQLVSLYLHAYQMFDTPLYRRVAEETLDYLQREMIDPAGGFYSSQDADSEGEEGKFFVWGAEEVDAALTPEEARVFKAYYNVTENGNFEGKNVLWIPRDPDVVAANLNLSERQMNETLERARQKLFQVRSKRVPPGTDTKVLTSWSALAIAAFAEASRVLAEPSYREVAERAAHFILQVMRDEDGRLLRTWKENPGVAKLNAYLEDYAYFIHALTYLYEATFGEHWLRSAQELTEIMLAEFRDPKGGFYDTGGEHERLVLRPKDVVDNATPSGNSMAALALLRLGAFLNEEKYIDEAHRTLQLVGRGMGEQPLGFGNWLVALDWWLSPTTEFALVGKEADIQPFVHEIFSRFLPNKIVAHAVPTEVAEVAETIPLLRERDTLHGKATAYLCQNFTCKQPVTDATELADQIEQIFA